MPRGGFRPGAGRKPKPKPKLNISAKKDPLAFLLEVMNDQEADARLRVRAAVTAAQYRHAKKGDSGKKDERKEAAEKAGRGKFAPAAPPRLRVVAGS
jgi:phage terminase small subunit